VEVGREILVGGTLEFGVQQFIDAPWLNKWKIQQAIPPFLDNTLDQGEAAVIQLALAEKIRTVCIDESVGRRVARLNGLLLTGSVGILLRAKREGLMSSVGKPLQRMQKNGIWLSDRVVSFALRQSGESEQE
jgi:predicted nucleic acid-binding protein